MVRSHQLSNEIFLSMLLIAELTVTLSLTSTLLMMTRNHGGKQSSQVVFPEFLKSEFSIDQQIGDQKLQDKD